LDGLHPLVDVLVYLRLFEFPQTPFLKAEGLTLRLLDFDPGERSRFVTVRTGGKDKEALRVRLDEFFDSLAEVLAALFGDFVQAVQEKDGVSFSRGVFYEWSVLLELISFADSEHFLQRDVQRVPSEMPLFETAEP